MIERLVSMNEFVNNDDNLNDMKMRLKKYERTRHLQIWHDGSTLCNHGHLLFCVNVLYDPAFFIHLLDIHYYSMKK